MKIKIKKNTIKTMMQTAVLIIIFILIPIVAAAWIEMKMLSDLAGWMSISSLFLLCVILAKKGGMTI